MKKRFAISAFFVLFLLIVSQLVWVNQVLERDKSRFKEEVEISINDIVKYQTTLQTYNSFGTNPETSTITIETVNPDTVPDNIKVYGNYETTKYERESTISGFIESVLAERLLEKEALNLQIIDSLFRDDFQYASELLAYSLKTTKKNETTDSLYFGNNAIRQLNDTTKGVFYHYSFGYKRNLPVYIALYFQTIHYNTSVGWSYYHVGHCRNCCCDKSVLFNLPT